MPNFPHAKGSAKKDQTQPKFSGFPGTLYKTQQFNRRVSDASQVVEVHVVWVRGCTPASRLTDALEEMWGTQTCLHQQVHPQR